MTWNPSFSRFGTFDPICHQIKLINPQAPVAQKTADEVVFRHFQGEGVEFFFKSDLSDPHQIFDANILVNDVNSH